MLENQDTAARRLARERKALIAASFDPGPPPEDFSRSLSTLLDNYFKNRLEEVRASEPSQAFSFALAAVGGYGRGELCPGSDIDLLILHGRDAGEAEVESACRDLLLPLWDLGLDVGHGVRTVAQTVELAARDPQVAVSLLDLRFLAGEREFYDRLKQGFLQGYIEQRSTELIRELYRMSQGEGRGLYPGGCLEPDLKASPGGLRDRHRIRWLAILLGDGAGNPERGGLIAPGDGRELDAAAAFISRTRGVLHYISRRGSDKLHLEVLPKVAGALGYDLSSPGLGVEAFLADLSGAMSCVGEVHDALFRRALSLTPPSARVPVDFRREADGIGFPAASRPDPLELLRLYAVAADLGEPVSLSARRLVRDNLEKARGVLPESPGTLPLLADIMAAPRGDRARAQLLESGLLGAAVPELGRVVHLVQFDGFHTHPLGVHSLTTISFLVEEAASGPELFRRVRARVSQGRVLALAGLLHDVAKGGRDHAARGAEAARHILARLGADPAVTREVEFLVANHLFLSTTALRSDLSDPAVVSRVAAAVGSAGRLDRLYLLSVADAMATGPKAWNSWTGSLLSELFLKTRKLLTEGPLAEPHAAQRIMTARDRFRSRAASGCDSSDIEGFLDAVPPEYMLSREAGEMVGHMGLLAKLRGRIGEQRTRRTGGKAGRGLVVISAKRLPEARCYEVSVAAKDQPELLATLAGAMSLHNVNILSAEVYGLSGGLVLNIFTVSEPAEDIHVDELWDKVAASVRWAYAGKLSLAGRLAERRGSPLYRPPQPSGKAPDVTLDNEASDFGTLIEVTADDRLGRLHDILCVLADLSLDVRAARIATAGGQIADVFIVRDSGGQKLTDSDADKARRALLDRLD